MQTLAWSRFTGRMEAVTVAALRGGNVRVPEGGGELWRLFVALCSARQGTGYGPQALTLGEIEAGARLYRTPLAPHHVAVLQAMDRAWLRAAMESQAPDGVKTLPRISEGTLTPALFDLTA